MAENLVECPVRADLRGSPVDVAEHVQEAHGGGYRMGRFAAERISPESIARWADEAGEAHAAAFIRDAVARHLIAGERAAREPIETPVGPLTPGETVTLTLTHRGRTTRRAGYVVGERAARGYAFNIRKGGDGPAFSVIASEVTAIAR